MLDPELMLHAAEEISGILKQHCIDAVVIGATALAAYRYVRQTEDLDLGVNALHEFLTSYRQRFCPTALASQRLFRQAPGVRPL